MHLIFWGKKLYDLEISRWQFWTTQILASRQNASETSHCQVNQAGIKNSQDRVSLRGRNQEGLAAEKTQVKNYLQKQYNLQ